MYHGERLNTFTHLMATLVAFVGAYFLLHSAASQSDLSKLVCFSIYCLTTIGLYFISTLYHGIKGPKKRFFQTLDYVGIYLKIAGNYTPFAVLILRGRVGWLVLGIVWTLAIIGICQEVLIGEKTERRYSMMIYGVMSLAVLPFVKRLIDGLPLQGFALIVAGYVLYAIGVYFFFNDDKLKHGHGIWHLLVASGTACQFLCLILYVA